MTSEYVYLVTHYGCNSGRQSIYPASSKTFKEYDAAYKFFLERSPSINDPENKAKQHVSENYKQELEAGKEFITIETREQIPGYYEGDSFCAKRPYGAIFAASKLL